MTTDHKAYYAKNKDRLRAIVQKHRDAHPKQHMLYEAQKRAKRAGIPFDLVEADITIPAICPVLGIPIFRTKGQSGHNSPSLDRIIPALGYVRGNVAVISKRANCIKNDATSAELLIVARWVASMGG